jgi:thymidylate synthase ThyX
VISADILLDSINPEGERLTTWVLKYPRLIHSELMTHRVFSRNAASSRAIPIEKMIADVETNPAMFEYWGSNKKGMQAGPPLVGEELENAKRIWLEGAAQAILTAKRLHAAGLHKQNANRVLEPWFHMTTLVTVNDYHNFFYQRAHKDAQPEFAVLAYRMLAKFVKSQPVHRDWGDWHIPFGDRIPDVYSQADMLRIATARCARVSYNNFEGTIDAEKDFALHDMLLKNNHWSPFEHCAMSQEAVGVNPDGSAEFVEQGNFRGWTQYRKMFKAEKVYLNQMDLEEILEERPEWVTLL